MAESRVGARAPSMRDETVRKATGRSWREWFALLDEAGCAQLDHGAIARRTQERFAVSPWWAQMVSVEYERARGLRAPNQQRDGAYSVSVSRTITAPVGELFAAVTDDFARWAWLPVDDLEPHTAVADRSARFGWSDGTHVALRFQSKGGRCQVTVDHERLRDGEDVARRRAFWARHLAELRRLCEPTA